MSELAAFLLRQLGRWRVLALDLPTYGERLRAAHRNEREVERGPEPA